MSSTYFTSAQSFATKRSAKTLPLFVVSTLDFDDWKNSAPASIKEWLQVSRFQSRGGASCLLPSESGPAGAVIVVDEPTDLWQYAGLPLSLPEGTYEAEPELSPEIAQALSLGWALGSYRFERYKKAKTSRALLVWPELADKKTILALSDGIYLGRDLVNTPASDMGPEELAGAAKALAKKHNAQCTVITGDSLIRKNYPMIHAVGRASVRAPRLIDLNWGKKTHPRLTLVGKGVCFDTGGLDMKPGQYMKLMKKDMGGAALVLGLAHVIMSRKLPIQLRILIPAVENSVDGNAMRPLDVLTSRKGVTVEVGDTDAEGRLVLADALFEASSQKPDLIVDAATLTGAARVALGTSMPAIFCQKSETWADLEKASSETMDPLWRLPLHAPYRKKLRSKVADISNIGTDGFGGAITAALFLQEFLPKDADWIHMDTMGYNLDHRPGRPPGGEALGLLALDRMLVERYGNHAPTPSKKKKAVTQQKKKAQR